MKATLKTLIVDDEPLARSLLASMLAGHADVEIVGMAGSVAEARSFLESETPDLVFLDMEMPGASGLDLRHYLSPSTVTIFVTAFENYALQAFDFGARDYLLKPVDPSRLGLALERMRQPSTWKVDEVTAAAESVSGGGKLSRIPLDRILWIEACQNYTMVRLVDGETPEMLPRSMSEWERLLPRRSFERLGRSIIIHLSRIDTVRWKSRDKSIVEFLGSTHQLLLGRAAAQRLKIRFKELS